MAGGSSDRVIRQVHRVFNLGAVGMTSDGELLEWFVTNRDESAESAFEELMNRHGPMVFGVCRKVLQDRHDAEDAYQAVFLVLAKRAGSIRSQESVASWLFGVAHRVAMKARNRTARWRAVDLKAAERTSDEYLPPEDATDWAVLHHEVERLPDRLRAPLVLCYLEGLTYGAAAQQLRVSEATLRGRMAQARKRLHRRLSWQGAAAPAVLLRATAPGWSPAPVPPVLVQSTIRIALGSASNHVATVLAREVLKAMIMKQVKFACVLAALASVGLSATLAWAVAQHPFANSDDTKLTNAHAAVAAKVGVDKQAVSPNLIRGVVVDEAGKPVAGATVRADAFLDREAATVSGPDGSFTLPVRDGRIDGKSLLARAAGGDLVGFFQYGYGLSATESARSSKIILKPGKVVTVRVSDANNSAIAGATVQVAGNFAHLDGAVTDDDGTARLNIPIDAKVEWIFTLESGRGFDYTEYGKIDSFGRTQGGAAAADLPASIALTLEGPSTVRLKAVDRDGKPLAGVSFYPWLLQKKGRRSQVNAASTAWYATTGPDGIAVFDWLPKSNVTLIFWPATEGFANRRVLVNEGETGPVTAKLTRTVAIRGRVVSPDGEPAAGIKVGADGTGQGMDSGYGRATTAADGSYEMQVSPQEAYAVYVDDKDWAAPTRLDVVVREGKPVDGVDFKLSHGTVIRGTVTVGPNSRPATKVYIRLDESGDQAVKDLHEEGDRAWRQVQRQFGEMTDSAGHYSIRVGPGTYTIMGPPRTGDEKLTVKDEPEIIRDFKMPRPEKGTLAGRVIFAGGSDKPIAGAIVEIVARNRLAIPFQVTADADGRFQAERDLDPLLICAKSPDGKLGAMVEAGAEDADVLISISPTATASGVLLDLDGKPAANKSLDWGRRVFMDAEEQMSMICFAPKVVTDTHGHFTLPSLVVGQKYGIALLKDNVYHPAGAIQPEKQGHIDLGTIRAGSYHPEPSAEEMSSFLKSAPGAGVVAPPVHATTLDGKPLELGDLKGKYVLLDFWAIWCGPCIGEIPQLQAVYDAFGNDERFAILSISVDEKIEEPKKFQEKRRLPWLQAFLGGGVQNPTTSTFGIRAIPAFVLVGPDGKIVARGMRGDDIKKEVAKALAKKPFQAPGQ
jgi:RNA polymerase sigma factor (sigma-70 family)